MNMSNEPAIAVRSGDSVIGELIDSPPFDKCGANARVRLSDGREVLVPVGSLVRQADGSYYLGGDAMQASVARDTVVPVMSEELVVDKRAFATGGVRVNKHVQEREELIDVPLLREHVDVRRVVIDQAVTEAPQVRYEGDTTIIPIVEEVLVVQKQLRLKEELHITKRRVEERHQERVTLRRDEPEVVRVDGEGRALAEEVVRETTAPVPPPLPVSTLTPPATPLSPVTAPPAKPGPLPVRRNKVIRND